MITSALGFGFITPTSSNPFNGVGIATGISTVLSLAISLFAGGFVAGLAARRTGILHGFLTWAVSVILLLTFVTSTITSVANTALNVTSSVVSTTGNAIGSVAGGAGNLAADGIDSLINTASDELGQVDTNQLQADVESVLVDTEIPELQPGYLQAMLDDTRDDLTQAGKDLVVNPENYETILDDLTTNINQRAETINQSVDRDAVANAVESNTELSQAESEEAVDNIINGYEEAQRQANEQIENLQTTIEETRVKAEQTVQELRVDAEEATDTISKGFLVVFVGLIIGLALAVFGGILGAQKVRHTALEE